MNRKVSKILIASLFIFISLVSYSKGDTIIEISKLENLKNVIHSSNTGGKILEINVKNGQKVEKDQVILKLKNKQIVSNYEASKNKYEIAKLNYERIEKFSKDQELLKLERAERAKITAEMNLQKAKNGLKEEELDRLKLNVETAKVNYETSKKNFEKNKVLYNKESISEQNFLQIKAGYESAQNNYESAQKALILGEKGADIEDINSLEAILKEVNSNYKFIKKEVDEEIWMYDINLAKENMEAAKSMYEFAKESYENLEVKAETSGIVANFDLDERNKVRPGEKLFTVSDTDKMILKIGVEEKNILDIEKNPKVEVFVSSVNKKFVGEIDSINPIADEKTKKFEVKIKIFNENHILKQGMHGEVTIEIN